MIELTDWLRDELIDFAEEAAPQECCGLISRPPYNVLGHPPRLSLWKAQNVSLRPETSFVIAPTEQSSIIHNIWERQEEVAGIYHSHPRSGAEPSELDKAIAKSHPPGLTWVIVGFPDGPEAEPEFWVGELP